MIEYNARLNNLFGSRTVQLQTYISEEISSKKNFSITLSGKIHELNATCPGCNYHTVVHNGNDKCKSKIIKELGLEIKRGKFKCKKCKTTWITKYEDSELFVKQFKQLIAATVFNLCTLNISLEKIEEHVSNVFSKKISHEWVRQLYIKAARTIEQRKVLATLGIFNYDEQHVTVNGKKYFRVVVMDAISKNIIFDETIENKRIETLKDKIRMKMLPYNKEAFIVDLALGYPSMLKELFPNVNVQWCIFHLNQRILHDFNGLKSFNKYGKRVLPLQQLYNQYLLFNLFFNHEVELQFLKRQLKKFTNRKEMLKGCGCYEKNTGIVSFYEMKLISEFAEFRRGLKKYRRKQMRYLLRNNKKGTLEILEKIKSEILLFPKKLQSRIKMICKNLDKLTLFQENPNVLPTNNNVEQYYSATLQKTAKKRFRITENLNLKLKIVREKWNGTLENLKFDFIHFLKLFGKINYFFGIT